MRTQPISSLVIAAFLAWSTTLMAAPLISGSSTLTPGTLGGGDVATFTFTFSNADTPQNSAMAESQLEILPIGVQVNGGPIHCELLSVSAPGGSVSLDFEGGMTVTYPTLAKGASRTVTATYQVPSFGLENGGVLHGRGTLTWSEAPGTFSSSATATLQASPSLSVSLGPVPQSVAPYGKIRYRAEYQNLGTGVARKTWMVIPVDRHTRLGRVWAGPARPQVWFSDDVPPGPHSLEDMNSDAIIRGHFTPGYFSDNGTPADPSDDYFLAPSGTTLMAVQLDDPALNLLPGGTGPQEISWEVEYNYFVTGILIELRMGWFCDEIPMTFSYPRHTLVRLLPADVQLFHSENAATLLFAGESGKSYTIQRSGDLEIWSDIGSAMETNPGFFFFTDMDVLPGKGFYRLAWMPDE